MTADLTPLFAPRRVAVLGASRNPSRLGHRLLRNLLEAGFAGEVIPVNPSGGLKSFGHPIGASGLRMLFEAWLQLRGEAGQRQIASIARGRKLALTHNLGGAPGECVSFVGVVGSEIN